MLFYIPFPPPEPGKRSRPRFHRPDARRGQTTPAGFLASCGALRRPPAGPFVRRIRLRSRRLAAGATAGHVGSVSQGKNDRVPLRAPTQLVPLHRPHDMFFDEVPRLEHGLDCRWAGCYLSCAPPHCAEDQRVRAVTSAFPITEQRHASHRAKDGWGLHLPVLCHRGAERIPDTGERRRRKRWCHGGGTYAVQSTSGRE